MSSTHVLVFGLLLIATCAAASTWFFLIRHDRVAALVFGGMAFVLGLFIGMIFT